MFSSPHLLPPELCRSSCFCFCFNLVANFVTALEKTICGGITRKYFTKFEFFDYFGIEVTMIKLVLRHHFMIKITNVDEEPIILIL